MKNGANIRDGKTYADAAFHRIKEYFFLIEKTQ